MSSATDKLPFLSPESIYTILLPKAAAFDECTKRYVSQGSEQSWADKERGTLEMVKLHRN